MGSMRNKASPTVVVRKGGGEGKNKEPLQPARKKRICAYLGYGLILLSFKADLHGKKKEKEKGLTEKGKSN